MIRHPSWPADVIPGTLIRPDHDVSFAEGVRRCVEDHHDRVNNAHGLRCTKEEGDRLSINGAIAEMCGARGLGIPWRVTKLGEPDLPFGIQCRSITQPHHRLILHPPPDPANGRPKGDNPFHKFVLVYRAPNSLDYVLLGWLFAYEGQIAKYWQDPGTGRPAFFIPPSDPVFRRMSPLRDWCQEQLSRESPLALIQAAPRPYPSGSSAGYPELAL